MTTKRTKYIAEFKAGTANYDSEMMAVLKENKRFKRQAKVQASSYYG